MASDRTTWVDQAKGLGILLVVFGHVWRGLHTASFSFPAGSFEYVDALIYAFHMPLFFFISGLFIERSLRKGRRAFLKDKLRSLIYPYVFWSVMYAALSHAMSRHTNSKVSFSDVVPSFLWRPYAHFWFLYVLFLATLLFWVLREVRLRPHWIAVFGIAVFLSDVALGPWGALYLLRQYFVYLAVGALVGPWLIPRLASVKPRYGAAGAAVCVVLLALGVGVDALDSRPAVLTFALVGTAAVLLAGAVFDRIRRLRSVALLGQWSLPIYLVHPIVGAATRIALRKAFGVESLAVHVVAGTLAGVVVPIGLLLAAERAGVPYLLGLPRPGPRPRPATS